MLYYIINVLRLDENESAYITIYTRCIPRTIGIKFCTRSCICIEKICVIIQRYLLYERKKKLSTLQNDMTYLTRRFERYNRTAKDNNYYEKKGVLSVRGVKKQKNKKWRQRLAFNFDL